MKTRGASRKKPSQRPPGSAHAAVIQPPPRSVASFDSPSARSDAASSASVSSRPVASRSGAEELSILLLPRDPQPLAFATAEGRIAVAGDLRGHPLAADREVQLDEVAEKLDEEDLALGRVRPGRRGAVLRDDDCRRANGDEGVVPDLRLAAGRDDARAHVVIAG